MFILKSRLLFNRQLWIGLIVTLLLSPNILLSQLRIDSIKSNIELEFKKNKLNPLKAAYLSYCFPTIGHAYIGNWTRGLPFLAGRIVGIYIVLHPKMIFRKAETVGEALAVIFCGYFVLTISSVLEAHDSASQAEEFNHKLMENLKIKYNITLNSFSSTPSTVLCLSITL